MSKIINLVIGDHDMNWLMAAVQELSFYSHIKIVAFAQTGRAFLDHVKNMNPDAVIVGNFIDMTTSSVISNIQETSQAKIFSLTDYYGVDVITKSSLHEIPDKLVLKREESLTSQISRKVSQRVIMTYNTKGGVGKTTIASNLAVAIQMSSLNQPVVLVDFDLGGCNVVTYTHLTDMDAAARNVTMWEYLSDDISYEELEEVLLEGPRGVKIVSSPVNQALAEKVTVDLADKVLKILKKHFTIIVIDSAPNISAPVDAALLHSTHVLLICNPEAQSINHLARTIHLLSPDESLPDKPNMSYILKKMFLVVNHKDRPSKWDIKTSDIAEGLDKPVYATIPFDEVVKKALHGSFNSTAFEIEPDGLFGVAIKQLADNICGAYPHIETQKKISFLRKITQKS